MIEAPSDARGMLTQQRIAAIGIVSVQAITLGALMDAPGLAGFAVLLALVNFPVVRRGRLISIRTKHWVAMVGVLFFLKYSFAPREFEFRFAFLMTELAYEVATFCLVVELISLYRLQNRSRLPLNFLAFAVVGMIFTGNVRLSPNRRLAMLILVQLFVIFWAWFATSSRRQIRNSSARSSWFRTGVITTLLVLALVGGTACSVLLHRNERRLEDLISTFLELNQEGPARAGFSGRGSLADITNWKQSEENELALSIHSPIMPGYMRGRVFDYFERDRWTVTQQARRLFQSEVPDEMTLQHASDQLYLPKGEIKGQFSEMKIWPVDRSTAGHCFGTLDTVGLVCRAYSVYVDRSGILTRPDDDLVSPYMLFRQPSRTPSRLPVSSDFLQLPESIDERVFSVAETIFDDESRPGEKIRGVKEFFLENFQYQLGFNAPPGEDRLGYFLSERVPAHCEYFATATAVLLRIGGVPSRYVTGYLAQEKNSVDGQWNARRKDAHAWVEAYDADLGRWVIVESTPAEGVPSPTSVSVWTQRREAFNQYVRSMQEAARRGQYASLAMMFVQPVLWGIAGLIALSAIGVALQRLLSVSLRRTAKTEAVTALSQERVRMDLFVAKYGLIRSPSETLLAFANRVETDPTVINRERVADWYRSYSTFRFRPRQPDVDLTALQSEGERIIASGVGKSATQKTEVENV
ncbi:transglutaminase domain-containing protein [Thalassoglobus sp. JC818]|uniref:transglutaminase family protein n=1 Tax=Thalassoglobus sp. JC818 TaxID=3232136 RepID=UPI00345AAC47